MPTPTAQQMLDLYLQAEQDVLAGKRVRLNDGTSERQVDSEDLEWIIAGRKEWERKVAALAAATARAPSFGGLSFSVARLDGR